MTATTTRRARGLAVAGALAATLALAGCAEEVPAPNPDDAVTAPVLSEDQDREVLTAVNQALTEAGAANDPNLLQQRLTGPALKVRTSQLQVAAARGNADLVTELPSEYQQLVVPTNETWPRTSFAITEQPENLQPPRLLALEQASAREPYKLWGWVQLAPGTTMPAFADPELGSEAVAPDDDSLLMTPQDAVAQYADVLTTGASSAFAASFAEDGFRKLLGDNAATQTQALQQERVEGTYTLQVTPTPDQPVQAVRTADDGAMVMAGLDVTETMQAVEGARLTPPTQSGKALLGQTQPTNVLKNGYTDVVALYVPPKGSEEQVRLLGYSHVQTSVATQ